MTSEITSNLINHRVITMCPKCHYEWFCRIILNKTYYQCPICKHAFKLTQKIEAKK